MTETFLLFAVAIALGWPLGLYLARVMRGAPMRGDALFGLIRFPEERAAIAHRAQVRARQYTPQRMAEGYLATYRSMVSEFEISDLKSHPASPLPEAVA